ncbi:MAG TPA: nuclear transport factor 2 family protein [Actinomycetota bacterium]|nr:nuclear transport factor 2 family protein [Actinomycetota bacterium]
MQESVGVSTRIGSKLGGEMERSQELEDLVRAWFGAASKGDASLIDRHVSRDPGTRLIGSDPNEWLDGEEIAGFLRGEAENAAGNATFTPSEAEAYSEGSVGWASTRLTITLPDGRFVSPRWSAVFHREDGEWRFVQTHASIAVPNEEIGWQYTG